MRLRKRVHLSEKLGVFVLLGIGIILFKYMSLYTELLLVPDGAYVLMQTREVLSGKHFDFLHSGYSYCGLLEHFFSGIYSFVVPSSIALFLGILSLYIIGFFLIKNIYDRESRFLLLMSLLLPLPNIFFQSYSSLGGHTYVFFQFLLVIYLLSHPRWKTKQHSYSMLALFLLGLSSGAAVYTYTLAKIVWISALLTVAFFELYLVRRTSGVGILKRVVVLAAGYQIGLMPYSRSMRHFGEHHAYAPPVSFSFDFYHVIERLSGLVDVYSYLYAPIFQHSWLKEGQFNHFTYPIEEVLLHKNLLAGVMGLLLLSWATVLGLQRLYLRNKEDVWIFFALCNAWSLIVLFVFRNVDMNAEHESRYFIIPYFVPLLLVFALVKKPLRKWAMGVFLVLSLIGHVTIIQDAYREIEVAKQFSNPCDGIAREPIFNALSPPLNVAIAGRSEIVWLFSAHTQNRNILDLTKNKFYYLNETSKKLMMAYIAYRRNGLSDIHLLDPERDLTRFKVTQCGPFTVGIESASR